MNDLLGRRTKAGTPLPPRVKVWELAVRLRSGRTADPDGLADVADLAGECFARAGLPHEWASAELARVWPLVRQPGGKAGWKSAVRLALLRPLKIEPAPGVAKMVVLASRAFYLSRHAAGGPFVFNGDRVARSLGMPRPTDFYQIRRLEERAVIHWHNPTWSRADGVAREAVFIGDVVGTLDPLRRDRRRP